MAEPLSADERIEVLRGYAFDHSDLSTFIETGTATGDTCAALAKDFDRLFTIELDWHVYLSAVLRFIDTPNVTVIQGLSEVVFKRLLRTVDRRCLYWLDAHYCGGARGPQETPVMDELREILWVGHPSVILVDDARFFGVDPAYPTLADIEDLFRQVCNDGGVAYSITVTDDIIRLVPEGGLPL